MAKKKTAKRGKESELKEEIEEEKPAKKQRVGINMKHIPKSLLLEGFKDDPVEPVIPDPFCCPICRELLIEPEMFSCGHTLCKLCITNTKRPHMGCTCPVCRASIYTTAPNLALRDVITQQYPEQQQKRAQQLKEIQDLGSKLTTYTRSARFKKVEAGFLEVMRKFRIIKVPEIIEAMRSSKTIIPAVTDLEIEYFIAWKLEFKHQMEFRDIGQLILHVTPDELYGYLDFLQNSQNKTELMRWSPLVMMTMNRGFPFDDYKRVADIHGLEIGEKIPIEDWLHRPAFWLKDLDIGEISEDVTHRCNHVRHMMPFYVDDSDDFNSDESDFDDYI